MPKCPSAHHTHNKSQLMRPNRMYQCLISMFEDGRSRACCSHPKCNSYLVSCNIYSGPTAQSSAPNLTVKWSSTSGCRRSNQYLFIFSIWPARLSQGSFIFRFVMNYGRFFPPLAMHPFSRGSADSQRASLSGVRKLKMVHYYLFSRPCIHLSDSFVATCHRCRSLSVWWWPWQGQWRRRRRINAYTIIFRYLISFSISIVLSLVVRECASVRSCVLRSMQLRL